MEMTKKMLEEYRSKKNEIRELRYKLRHLGEGDSLVGNSTVLDCRTGYPRPRAVVGFDREKYNRLKERYRDKLDRLLKECETVELWIEDIPDSLTRRIFRMYYVDGMNQEKIAKKVNMERSSVSRKMDRYIKVAHNSHDAHV